MSVASSIGSAAAGVLGKKAKEFVFGGATHASWTDFYLAMAFDMESPSFVDEAINAAISAAIDYSESFLSEENQKAINTVRDNSSFAKQLVDNYDKDFINNIDTIIENIYTKILKINDNIIDKYYYTHII